MFRTRVKICGITNVEDALMAIDAGADALGLVFYPPSPRYVDLDTAAAIRRAVQPFVTLVGLFVNAPADDIRAAIDCAQLDLLQFHGDESESACTCFGRPYIKALRVREGETLEPLIASYSSAQGILLDTYVENVPGGTGRQFDWRLFPQKSSKPLILAGGLDAQNVSEAIRSTHPYAVDVSGGVEASKGRKDEFKLRQFIREVAGE
ncbi:MAG: phosphoribosylanthranilate isomerase [Hahellaceae bacterium]|nr:phosphoribosylanthranilate isomerase [Hahellaceae bacterium]